ncbi:PAS domain S-box-containing protein [Halogranum gelatinilyticum]|uniref:PAS domain S-box-containing protein n=1 Tax=Halogranum gelatinilyticum TaxID=660521 RepID=A0A1G9NRH7_9EURY|nr:bacterio-opsin activator domain-containing protein [Halogranum gelatinilyticum]SDL88595.1 PAS domain S-box-containing protein [Halogranum gelatinilyticum]
MAERVGSQRGQTDTSIRVLLVDDDNEWVTLVARLLEGVDDAFSVTTANSVVDARALFAPESFDCVVCDYRMPGGDGLSFLSTVRETDPDLPFILATATGSESVASEATAAGATGYFVKDPRTDQGDELATRITQAVERVDARQAADEGDHRFERLFERVPDPVVVAHGPDLVVRTVNPAFEAVFGHDADQIVGEPLGDYLKPAGDDDELFGVPEDVDLDGTRDAEVTRWTVDGPREYHLRLFVDETADGTREVYGHYTDITASKERERLLEAERDATQEVRDILVNASSRTEVETAFVERLVESDGYRFVWVGRQSPDDSVAVGAAAGDDDDYLDGRRETGETVDGPSDTVFRTNEPQFVAVPGVDDGSDGSDGSDESDESDGSDERQAGDDDAAWLAEAAARGFTGVAALPVTHGTIPYGVLVVYTDDPEGFDETDRRLLTETAASLGSAVDVIGRRASLSANRVVQVVLASNDATTPLAQLSVASGCRIDVSAVVPEADDRVVYFVELDGTDAATFVEHAEANDRVTEWAVLDDDERTPRLRLSVEEPSLATVLTECGVVVRSQQVDRGSVQLVVEFPQVVDANAVTEELRASMPDLTVRRHHEVDRLREWQLQPTLPANLTERQLQALRTAYYGGYFERPRLQSAAEVAESLGISRSTFLQHLRVAESKVFGELFE